MSTTLYDIRFAPIDIAEAGLLILFFAVLMAVLAILYSRQASRKWPRKIFYGAAAAAVTAVLTWVAWSQFDRRAECISILEQGHGQVVQGPLNSFKRVYGKGKSTVREVRFTVNGLEFVEQNVAARTCGIAQRFTDLGAAEVGDVLRVTYFGDAVLQVIRLSGGAKPASIP